MNRIQDRSDTQTHRKANAFFKPLAGAVLCLLLAEAGPAHAGTFGNRHALVIGVDGVRPDALIVANTPNLDALIASGVVTYDAFAGGVLGTASQQVTSSGPGWTSILTGVWVDQHGVSDNSFSGYQSAAYPHFFRRLADINPTASLSSIVHWSPIDTYVVAPADTGGAFHRVTTSTDAAVATAAADRLTLADPDVMFLHFDDVDGAGHSSGYSVSSPTYLAAIEGVDTHVGTVLAALQARPGYASEDWLVVVTTDHGGLGTGHGGQSTDERTIFLVSSRAGTSPQVISPGPGHTAVPPTVLSHLGVPIDPAWGWEDAAFGVDPLCPGNLSCTKDLGAGTLTLNWSVGAELDVDAIEVVRDGAVLDTLAANAITYVDTPALPAPGEVAIYVYEIRAVGGTHGGTCFPATCVVTYRGSYAETWMPPQSLAGADTDVGVVLNPGDSAVDTNSIVLRLDGVVQNAQVSVDSGRVTVHVVHADILPDPAPFDVLSSHLLEVSYQDSLDGAKTLSHAFDIALLVEDFEGLPLGPNVDETLAGTDVWTKTAPAGWSVDDTAMPRGGVTEWAGWSFADKYWWATTAEDQQRSQFALGQGTVAVADADEWDDLPRDPGTFHSFLETPPIPLAGVAEDSAILTFDSSWRDENTQTALVLASFDGAPPVEILRWESAAGPNFKDDAPNEAVQVPIPNPAAAAEMVLSWGLVDAGNNWWWAIDNVMVASQVPPYIDDQPTDLEVDEGDPATFAVVAGGGSLTYQWYTGTGAGRTAIAGATAPDYTMPATTLADHGTIYSVDVVNGLGTATSDEVELQVVEVLTGTVLLEEDFDGVPLGLPVDEADCGDDVWNPHPPAGWVLDHSGVPGFGDPATDGMREFAGWNFMDRDWYVLVAGDQNRSLFTLGVGTVAVADGDEWDDAAHSDGLMDTFMSTPPIPLSGAAAGTLNLTFDSSWRDYANQTATISVSYDGGTGAQVMRWASQGADPDFKNDNENETVAIPLSNPGGATSAVITFGYTDAGNDWWWAIDNLVVSDGGTTYFSEDFEGIPLGQPIEEVPCGGGDGVWTDTPPPGWVLDDSGVPSIGDPNLGMTEWEGWSFVEPVSWAQMVGQARGRFTKGDGAIAVADPEGWEDKGGAATLALGSYHALMITPSMTLAGVTEGTVAIQFDSSWNPVKSADPLNQTAVLTASYDGGAPVEVLRWESDSGGMDFKPAALNETVTLHFANPAGVASMVLEFGMLNAGNDGWWAVDNLVVVATVVEEPTITSLSVAGGNATLSWDPPGSADQVQKATDLVAEDWGNVGAPTDQGTATVPVTGDMHLYRVVRP